MNINRTGVLLLSLITTFLIATAAFPQNNNQGDGSISHHKSWYLEFHHKTPDVYIHEDEAGNHTRFLYMIYSLRNNYKFPVPVQIKMVLRTDQNTYHPATAYRNVEFEILREELDLGVYPLGLQNEKILNLKSNGRYLSWTELQLGTVFSKQVFQKNQGTVDWKTKDIKPLVGRGGGNKGTFLRGGDTGFKEGEPFPQGLEGHPNEITGIVLFKGVDVETSTLEFRVGGLLDPIKRDPRPEASVMNRYESDPRVLEIEYDWQGPSATKTDQLPVLVRKKFQNKEFGPVATLNALRSKIDILANRNLENIPEQQSKNPVIRTVAVEDLRSLTNQNFGYNPQNGPKANREAIERWNEWLYRNKHDLAYAPTPEPHFEIVKKPRPQTGGAQNPESILDRFEQFWNKRNWKSFLTLYKPEDRSLQNMESLFWKIGSASNVLSTNVTNRTGKLIDFEVEVEETKNQDKSEIYRFQLKEDLGRWFLAP